MNDFLVTELICFQNNVSFKRHKNPKLYAWDFCFIEFNTYELKSRQQQIVFLRFYLR